MKIREKKYKNEVLENCLMTPEKTYNASGKNLAEIKLGEFF